MIKKLIGLSAMLITMLGLSACNNGSENNSNGNLTNNTSNGSNTKTNSMMTNGTMIKASYLQMAATGSLSAITANGYGATNLMLFAFADPTTTEVNKSYLSAMQTAISHETAGTTNLLSFGGASTDPTKLPDPSVVINNIVSQINSYNSQLSGGKISGVDIDLEGNVSSDTIMTLAKGFKAQGLLVSLAAQVYNTGSNSVDVNNPTNLVLTAGIPNANVNIYGPAIASGYADYIMAQTYNSGNWTVGGVSENQVQFFQAIAQALNNTVKADCSNNVTIGSNLCIPQGTKIVIGEVSNASGASNAYNIFGVAPGVNYDQAGILQQLNNQITTIQNDPTNYGNISGVMQWSLNNDYMPTGWNDNYATPGLFSNVIFGAALPPTLPYFVLNVSNTDSNQGTAYPYASVTLVVNGQYWVFGNQANQPLAQGASQLWGTQTAAETNPEIINSYNLDQIFSNGATSFTASSIVINGYKTLNDISKPDAQWNCTTISNYNFQATKSYHVMVNPTYQSCDVELVN